MFTPKLHLTVRRNILPINLTGRDFILGDLHGCFAPLMKLLRAVRFSPRNDRLFSVGDLIDRGPQSSRCLRLINRSWFHPVLGNHDIAFVIYNFPPRHLPPGTSEYYCSIAGHGGGEWYTIPPLIDFAALCVKLNSLPHILTVGTDEKPSFHVVHASLHCFYEDIRRSDADIGSYFEGENQDDKIWTLTHERNLWVADFGSALQGLASTFCGHSMKKKPIWSLSHLDLDTGAGYPDTRFDKRRLSMADLSARKIWSVMTNKPGKVICRPFPRQLRPGWHRA